MHPFSFFWKELEANWEESHQGCIYRQLNNKNQTKTVRFKTLLSKGKKTTIYAGFLPYFPVN